MDALVSRVKSASPPAAIARMRVAFRPDLDERIVQYEHDRCRVPSPFLIPKEYLTNIAYIPYLRMPEAKSPFESSLAATSFFWGHFWGYLPNNQGRV
jgi:hypothetical protein